MQRRLQANPPAACRSRIPSAHDRRRPGASRAKLSAALPGLLRGTQLPERRRLSGQTRDRRIRRGLGARRRDRRRAASWPPPPASSSRTAAGSRCSTTARSSPRCETLDQPGTVRGRGVARVDQPPLRPARERRRRTEPFLTLVKAIMQGGQARGRDAPDRRDRRGLPSLAGALRAAVPHCRTRGGLLRARSALHHEPARAR